MSNNKPNVIYDNLEQYLHDKRVKKEDKNKKRTHTRIPSSNPEEDGFWEVVIIYLKMIQYFGNCIGNL